MTTPDCDDRLPTLDRYRILAVEEIWHDNVDLEFAGVHDRGS